MAERRGHCRNNPNNFCYIGGEYLLKDTRRNITDFVKKSYHAYFVMKLGDQDKYWASHECCTMCTENLRKWTTGKLKSLKFRVPMVWRGLKNNADHCYYCMVNMAGFNRQERKTWSYPNLESALRPVPHSDEIQFLFLRIWIATRRMKNQSVGPTKSGKMMKISQHPIFSHREVSMIL